jgi:hypothetical protein
MKRLIIFLIVITLLLQGCSDTEPISNKIKEVTPPTPSNSLYLPEPQTSWQWQLSGDINTEYDVEMYDIDVNTPQNIINELHERDIKVICYFSAGTYEDFRDDANKFPKVVLGNALEDWPDEKWIDISNYNLFSDIMEARMDLAVKKKCDGIEPDNIDGYENNNGFNLNYNDQLEYNRWLSKEAHERGLSIGLKNDVDQINDLVDYFDFAINEQCFEYDECHLLEPFIEQNKAVFGVEYELTINQFCKKANAMRFSWLQMNYELDGEQVSCDE